MSDWIGGLQCPGKQTLNGLGCVLRCAFYTPSSGGTANDTTAPAVYPTVFDIDGQYAGLSDACIAPNTGLPAVVCVNTCAQCTGGSAGAGGAGGSASGGAGTTGSASIPACRTYMSDWIGGLRCPGNQTLNGLRCVNRCAFYTPSSGGTANDTTAPAVYPTVFDIDGQYAGLSDACIAPSTGLPDVVCVDTCAQCQ